MLRHPRSNVPTTSGSCSVRILPKSTRLARIAIFIDRLQTFLVPEAKWLAKHKGGSEANWCEHEDISYIKQTSMETL